MAIYHFSGTIISRSQGRSAVACAAYRSAEKLLDVRQDKVHDYTKKIDVAHVEILAPEQAPYWMLDRETLWNGVEASEKRKDAQLAREFNFSLPRELTLEQNIALAREFVQSTFVSKGMVADLAVHNDQMPDGQLQPHAHVMLTLREVTPEGFGQKVREWNAKEQLLSWREAWGEMANKHLFLHGHDITIDHRTLAAQEIDLEPQHKIGAAVAKERMARLEDHQRIARENGERLLKDPGIALHAITRQQSTFTHQDIARFVDRQTADAEQFQTVYDKVKGHEDLVSLGLDDRGRERYTTKEMLAVETLMVERAGQLAVRTGHRVNDRYQNKALQARSLTSEQKTAFEHLVSDGDLKSVIGYAGSGKSYLLGAAKEAWEAEGYSVHGVTLSGIAAENLEGGSGITSRTIASRSYYWDKGEQLLTPNDILVVDEAGMIGSRQLNRLLGEAERGGAKIVLVGDPYQLQAIEAGAAFRAIAERSPIVELTEIRRQTISWQREATVELAKGQAEEAINRYVKHDHVHAFESNQAAKQGLVDLWNDARISQPGNSQIILTYTRADVKELNEIARGLRREQGELGDDHVLMTGRGERTFATHDRVYFLENDRDLGVKNGTLGTIDRIQGNMLVVRLDKAATSTGQDKAKTITFSTDRYNQIDHGYAATIHKSQGVTVDRSYVLASKYMDGHAAYVGLSRHRESTDVFYSRDEFANEHALAKTLGRDRSKDVTLDYTQDHFTRQRGFDRPEEEMARQRADESEVSKNDRAVKWREVAKRHEALVKKQSIDRVDPFADFKAKFEAKNPEKAQYFQEALQPRHERLALAAEKQLTLLEKTCEESRTPRTAREQLEKYAASVAKQPEVMEYLKKNSPALTDRVRDLAKSHERSREKSLGLSR